MNITIESSCSVREHPQFVPVFGEFAVAMGIIEGHNFAHWKPLVQKLLKYGCDIGIAPETLTQKDYEQTK